MGCGAGLGGGGGEGVSLQLDTYVDGPGSFHDTYQKCRWHRFSLLIHVSLADRVGSLLVLHTAVSGKVVQRRRKAYATIPKGSMGLSEESVHVLNIHMIKKDK